MKIAVIELATASYVFGIESIYKIVSKTQQEVDARG
jgi:hypothetical protein